MTGTSSDNHTWEIRPAREEDAAELSDVVGRIFHDTFAPFNTPEDMEMYRAEAFTPGVMLGEIRDPDTDVIVAADAAGIVGYAHLHRGPAPKEVHGTAPIELKRFYILHTWHGTGLAQAMLKAVAGRALEHGAGTLWLGVWEHNTRAIRFYHKLGFQEVGEQPFTLGTDLQRDLVMAVVVEKLVE